MPRVEPKHRNETFDSMFNRFKKAVEKADTLMEVRNREHFEKPSTARKRAKAAARKRQQRLQAAEDLKHGRRTRLPPKTKKKKRGRRQESEK